MRTTNEHAPRATILAEGRSSFPAQGANASAGNLSADFAAPSEPVARPRLGASADASVAGALPPREALDSARPVRTLADRMADETEEELARRERAAADAKRRAALARTVTVPQVGAAKRRAS